MNRSPDPINRTDRLLVECTEKRGSRPDARAPLAAPGLEVLGSDYEALADIAVSAARAGESV